MVSYLTSAIAMAVAMLTLNHRHIEALAVTKIPPGTELKRFATVTGSTVANDAFWARVCQSIPPGARYLALEMTNVVDASNVVDFFRPVDGATFCDMLTSSDKHRYSPDGLTYWVTPEYSSVASIRGGSADNVFQNFPVDLFKDEKRLVLSVWGHSGTTGDNRRDQRTAGCCSSSSNRTLTHPKLSINGDFTYWGQEFVFSYVADIDTTTTTLSTSTTEQTGCCVITTGLFTPEVTCEGGRTLIWCNDVLANLDPSAVWAETTFEVGTTCAEASALCPTTTAATTVAAVATTTVAHDASNAEKGGDATAGQTLYNSKPEKCRKDEACGYAIHCIFLGKKSENDCSLCSASKRECEVVAAERNARNVNSAGLDCEEKEYIFPATHRSFAKCRKLVGNSYKNKMDNKAELLLSRGQRSDCSRYIFDYRGDQQSAAEQFWNSSGAAADTLAWNVCGVGPSWFQVSCGRALITQLFLSTFDDIFTSYEKFDATTTITDVDADASGENGVVGNETSATALLTPDGQCRYGVTSVLSSFAEDCHKASKRLKRRLKQANSLSTKDTLEPNEEITCRCVSKEEMQVANLNRLTLRKNLFEDTYHIHAAGFGGVVIFGIILIGVCCIGLDGGFSRNSEECEACCFGLLVGIGITIGVCMMFIWYPEQGFRRQAKFNTIRPDDANAYWQGCGETITMDLTFSPADRGLTYNDDGNVWTVGVPDTQTAVSAHHMSMAAKVNGSESEPATCKKAYVCSLSYNFMEVPHCIFSSTSENDCSLCFFAKSDCRIAAAQRNARSSSSATACDEGKYLMPATDRKFAECKSVSSGYTNRKSNKQSRIEGRAQRSECSKYALVADDQSTQAELFWLSEDDLMNQTSWGVCERGPSWFKKACIAAHTHPSVGGAATNRYMPSGFIGTAATDDLLSVDGECRYGVTSVLSSFGEDCHTASKKLKKRLKQSDSILTADDLEPNGEITCRCVSKTEMEVAHLSQFSNFYDRASRALKQRINKFRAATNHASDFWNGCGIGSAAGNPIPYFAKNATISTTATSSTTTTTTTTTIATTATTTLFNATYECSDDTRVVATGDTGSDAENNSPMLFGFALPLWFLPETSISAPLLDETSVEDLQSCQDLCASITGCISMTFAAGIEGDASPGSLAGANRRSIRSSGSGSGSMSGDDVDDDGSGVQVAAKHDGNSSNCKMYGEASMRDPDAKIDVTGITEPHAGTVYCVIVERQDEAMALRRRTSNKNDINDFGKLAGIGGGIVLVTIVHYYLNPSQRDFDLYLLVTGGLLDAATDSVYLATEDFQSWELKLAATFVMTLPIVLVALGFWAVIFIDYRKRPWRRLLLPIEGPLKLLFVIYAGSTAFGVAAAARIVQGPLFFHNILFDDDFFLRSSFNDLRNTLFTKEEVFVVDEDEKGDITVKKKFWEKGLTQLLLAFLGFPILVIIVVSIFIAIVVVVWAIGIAVTLISICVAALIGALFAVLLPIMFAILAFFRLFVLLPTIWKGITNLTIAFAEFAGNRFLFSSCFKAEFSGFEDGAIFFSAEMAKTIRYKTFHILDDSAKEKTRTKINTLKKTTVNYLVLEFAFESVPQMSIQVINNEERQNWSAIGIASLIVSVYAIASTLYKYGYERFCKTRYDKAGKKVGSNASTATTSL